MKSRGQISSRFSTCLVAALFLWTGSARAVDFDKEVRPILSDKCFHCHGPDAETREAGLRLDLRDGAFADLGGYAAFVRGDVEGSEAIQRVLSEDADTLMPPPASKLSLSESEKKTLQRWVREGAEWSEHWSFVRPVPSQPPADPTHWSRNEIDQFIRRRLNDAGLAPQPEAPRETLIRRLSLDLTGLPPTPAEIDAFLSDTSSDAYEHLVDRLLASPRYGERMAWEWLDASRYADTDGFQGDPTRTMWPWRDWLVDALNENQPFDQFTIEMLAGDLLPGATPEQVLATGFNRNHMFNGEGGRIPEETRVENVFDRTETTGTVWLGLTMTCCRCHDHKYDAISNREYFQLYAFFNNTSENGRSGRGKTAPVLNYLEPGERERRAKLEQSAAEVQRRLDAPMPQLDAAQAAWQRDLHKKIAAQSDQARLGNWFRLGPIAADGRKAYDNALAPEKQVDLERRLGELAWQEQPDQVDGRVIELPTIVGATYFYRSIEADSARALTISLGSDDAFKVFLNGKEIAAKFVARAAAADQETVKLSLNEGHNELLIKIVNTGGIGGFYFRKLSESLGGLPEDVVLALTSQSPNKDQQSRLRSYYRSQHDPEWKRLSAERDRLQKQLQSIDKRAVTVMVMDDLKGDRRRQTFMLQRGGYDKPTDVAVEPDTPGVLPPLPTGTRDRLALAKWIIDPENPLTARVTVNRYWQTFFGKGIVRSTEDFGAQGARPTHPELLDWLAVDFVRSGWNVKRMHKKMVMSATYRQTAEVTGQALEVDPQNLWFGRAPRHRLPSWMLRDQALAVSGLLNATLGGPPIKPYQPAGIWAEATFGKIRYAPDQGDRLYRRSLYVFWRRIVGPTQFFDVAKRQTCEVKPTRTNTPLHALTTLNETGFVEAARQMAGRVMSEKRSDEDRVRHAFRLATARFPDASEQTILLRRLAILRQDFANDSDGAEALLNVGDSQRDTKHDATEQAALTMVCSMILNLDETLSRP